MLPNEGMNEWLTFFNICWNEGMCPGVCIKAEVIPILKNGKDPKRRESYIPVSSTSVFVKVLERMIVNRLSFWMEREGEQMASRSSERKEHRGTRGKSGARDPRWVGEKEERSKNSTSN